MYYHSPESRWPQLCFEQQARQVEMEDRGDFQTRILFDYLRQITGDGEERLAVYQAGEFKVSELIVELKRRLFDGRLRINWTADEGEPLVGVIEGEERFVQAQLPQWMFDMIGKYSDLYYQLRRPLLKKGLDRLTEWFGSLAGVEVDGYATVEKLSAIQMARAEKEARDVVAEIVRWSVKLAE